MPHDFQSDIDAVGRVSAVPTILDVVCRTTGMGFAAVARVTSERWVTCQVLDNVDFGLKPGDELQVETTICHDIRQTGEMVVINHVAESNAFRDHRTPALYGFQSYISMPIVLADGSFFGTLCAIDPKPAKLENPETVGMFKLFAELIASHLDAERRLAATEESLVTERQIAEFREQFIAVLGHDLRNPVASIDAGTKMLLKRDLDARAVVIVDLIQGSVLRMRGLIDNLLDFARGRMGGGLTLNRSLDRTLQPALDQVVDEMRSLETGSRIEARYAIDRPVDCDPQRLSQLLSNLLGNALAHGDETRPILVDAATRGGEFVLSVANAGEPIPASALADLFKPFFRAEVRSSQQGLGFGLYIASEIARAHDGTLGVESSGEQTCFTFRMPLAG